MSWFHTFNDIFWISIASMTFACLVSVLKYAFKSKCDQLSLCFGLINVHRAVELERDDDRVNPPVVN
jgi:hypothetical protein